MSIGYLDFYIYKTLQYKRALPNKKDLSFINQAHNIFCSAVLLGQVTFMRVYKITIQTFKCECLVVIVSASASTIIYIY